MKRVKSILLSLFLLIFISSFSQTNLVPNGSFESYTNCPSSVDQVSYCQNWNSYRNSPDYFTTCSSTNGIFPPKCFAGYQQPQSGNAYAGFVTYDHSGSNPNYREMIGTKLTSILNVGTKYYFSFFVNFGGEQAYEFATNKIGLRFSTVSASTVNPFPINNFAHYYCSTKITDSLNWTHLKGSFIADSLYQYLVIGNFFNDVNTDTISTGAYNQIAYYYIDNICLSTDSNFAYNTSSRELNTLNKVSIYPNPCKDNLNIHSSEILYEIELVNLVGTFMEKLSNLNSFDQIINVSPLSNGVYFLRIKTKSEIYQEKIIISK